MDILSELETAAKWAKINSYAYLFCIITTILSAITGFVMLLSLAGGGDAEAAKAAEFMKTPLGFIVIIVNVFWIVFYWICRNVFSRYEQSLKTAIQSLSSKEIEEVCHYQRNVFITYGAYYLIFMAMFVLIIGFVILVFFGAMGSMSGAVS